MGMQQATEKGTARRCQIKGISIAGKTGTGQWRNHNMNLNLAWFVGFAPVNEPEVAVAILVEGVIPQDQVQGGANTQHPWQKICSRLISIKKMLIL